MSTAPGDLVYGQVVNWSLLSTFNPGRRVLDVGCGTGAWSDELRARGAHHLVGVELSAAAAQVARSRYDLVLQQPVEQLSLDALGGVPFDTIVVADVIEHLVDPWAELERWTRWGRELVISTPNLRHFRVVAALALHGRFDYEPEGGIMDRTHLRWFTRRSLDAQLRSVGWTPKAWNMPVKGRAARLDAITGSRLAEVMAGQLQVVATSTRWTPEANIQPAA
jgi:SAM-dependent methyltransferase